jgi:hypothetical protein
MEETIRGSGLLRSVNRTIDKVMGPIEVDYEIHINSSLETVKSGSPPVKQVVATVSFVKATDGRRLPEGYYELKTPDEFLRLKHVPIAGWFVITTARGYIKTPYQLIK